MQDRDARLREILFELCGDVYANANAIPKPQWKIDQALTAIKQEYEADVFRYLGGEDDGYGGKTAPITWKEECEDQERYETWAMKEMKKACDKIKAHPKWEYGENAYPSPYERAIVAGCCQAVEQLKKELADALCGNVKPKKCIHICPICDDEAEPPEYEKCKIPNCECGGEAILNAEAEPKGFYDDTHNKDRCHPTSESEVERLRKFADYVLQSESWGNIDGGDIQDKAVELDLVELRPVDKDENEYGADELYFTKWTPSISAKG